MENTTTASMPNANPGTDHAHNAVHSLDNIIAGKMAQLVDQAREVRGQAPLGNPDPETQATATGSLDEANQDQPVVPEGAEITDPDNENSQATEEEISPEEVTDSEADSTNSTQDDLIDFIEFADSNPNAKFKFIRNGKEVVIDAKKAASILGQGAAISEDARQLKVERAEFDEYLQNKRAETEGLNLAMEFTIQPQLQKAYDEVSKVQQYQVIFKQQLAQATDHGQAAQIQAAMEQNEQYIQQQSNVIRNLRPRIDQFRQLRSEQVQNVIENNRKQFKDKDLKNNYVFNEIRERVSKNWQDANNELVPGVKNIDLISSDEHILGLIRDGLKYRDRPKSASVTANSAAATLRRTSGTPAAAPSSNIDKLRQAANKGDRKAADNLLMARLTQIRGQGR